MNNQKAILISLFLLVSLIAPGQDIGVLSFTLTPGGALPVGDSTSYFNAGGGAGLSAGLDLASFPLLFFKADLGYNYLPIETEYGVSLISAGIGAGHDFKLLDRLSISPYAGGGYYHGIVTDGSGTSGSDLYLAGGFGVYYSFLPSFSLGLDLHYINNFALYSGLCFSLGTTFHLPLKKSTRVRVEKELPEKPQPLEEKKLPKGTKLGLDGIEFGSIYPVLFKYYDTHPVGKVVLRNWETTAVSDISLSFFVERYMDNPKKCEAPDKMKGGEEEEVDLYALFTDDVLNITEGTKVSAKIILEYTLAGKSYSNEYIETLRMYDRNSLTWDDDRKAAAFVTAKDPMVLEFSKNVAGWITGKTCKAVNSNLCMAMALHEALRIYGMTYVVDPTTPFAEFSKDKLAVDFLQFPRQTLIYTAGDCDDLSILYNALLESVGITTAFITVPGHIFIAFSLDMTADEARRSFLRADELIFRDDKSWLPVEITKVKSNFLEAWQAGAKQWRENEAREQAEIYPVHTAWQEYEPVGLPGSPAAISFPFRTSVVDAFQQEMVRFIDREIYPRVSRLQGEIRKSGSKVKYINKLGVLYAKYELTDRAMAQFNKTLKTGEYYPALINMGNIYYLQGSMERALEYYERAAKKAPDNPRVLLCLARVSHELENYGLVRKSYARLKSVDPDLAEQFAYLDLRGEEAARAAEMSAVTEVVVWEEE
ncbi:MAG: tetratricopeptide repeat protein [Spirochaeta sp.]|nr:tetratricopeptide repeat protein [Spirochaeta sp.]